MTDKDNQLIESFFQQAAEQQVEDRGFTDRVMASLPDERVAHAHLLSRLWTVFCVVVAGVLFFVLGGWPVLKGLLVGGLHMMLGWLQVFVATAPTTEISVNPAVLLLAMFFVVIYLPYRIARRWSAVL